MKRSALSVVTLCTLLAASAPLWLPSGASAQDAIIKIDILRQIGDIDRNLYGVFMEPIRSTMDGLLYDPDHPLANDVYLGDWAMHLDEYISTTWRQIRIAKVAHDVRDKPFHIAFTEWSPGTWSHMSTLAGALHFNLFLRHADAVKRSNFTLFTSLLGRNQEGETYRSPFFHMFKLFSTNVHGTALDAYVESDAFDGRVYQDIPYLDVSASHSDPNGVVVINVVNRHMEEAITTDIMSDTGDFVGGADVSVIQAEDVTARYTFEQRDLYAPATSTVQTDGPSFRYTFAPHSFTQIRVRVE